MPEQLRFDGRVVIVTGAGAGLGRAYALLFASRGASVVVNDLGGSRHGDGTNSKAADSVVEEIRRIGGKAVANYNNVLDGEKIVKTAIDAFGRIDIVVNNAGILRDKSFMKMTENDWDIIQDVHVKGAVKTTKAAWPYFVKQKYGRIIVTASNSGLYGNFGQANYSSAKMALVGLSNTLSIEGKTKNIHCNVIVPTAASRLTEDIVPPDFFAQLKPELIAPIVLWLCHESCEENGSIVESAMGWAGKCHLVRSDGCLLRKSIQDGVEPETVQEKWDRVTDMSTAKHYDSIQEVSGILMNIMEELKMGKNESEHALEYDYNYRDVIMYALGVGATLQEPSDLALLYENHDNFAILPTFYTLFGPLGCMNLPLLQNVIPGMDLNPARILHGEQFLEVYQPLPTEGKIENRFVVQDVLDKGRTAVLLIKYDSFDVRTGEKLASGQITAIALGAGGFGGKKDSVHVVPIVEPPRRSPDASVTQRTSVDQAALYRLSGDTNPLHIDPSIAEMGGFSTPILHGLCSLGFAVRHVLQTYALGCPENFKSLKARFAKPVIPGQSLRTDMWQNGSRIHFQTFVVETNTPVVTGAYVDLKELVKSPVRRNLTNAKSSQLESDAVFQVMKDYVKSHPEEVKKINAVFLYIITSNGTEKGYWTLDLKNGELHQGHPKSGKADATLKLEDKDMVQMALGKLNPQLAFMKGKLKITGNIMLTQKLKTLMEANKAKL